MILIDTDVLSRLEDEPIQSPTLSAIILARDPDARITTTTAEERLKGRLADCAAARTTDDYIKACARLVKTLIFLRKFEIELFDTVAGLRFQELVQQKIRIGTNDLRIAAVALDRDVTLVTQNLRDFRQVPGLKVFDPSRV
jgi:tRNA(fMet)-specific endonuclease VapC